jgi:hypothetical protein
MELFAHPDCFGEAVNINRIRELIALRRKDTGNNLTPEQRKLLMKIRGASGYGNAQPAESPPEGSVGREVPSGVILRRKIPV